MAIVDCSGVELAYGSGPTLLNDITFRHDSGWLGVVGANGHGKSSLMHAIAGAPLVRSGRLRITGHALVCEQASFDHDAINDLGSRADSEAQRLRARFALDPEALTRFETLSSGEAKRWHVAAAIAREPDILIVDEPTNHIDAAARELIIHLLQRYRGLGLVVSHDRELLERLTQRTLRVHRGTVAIFDGAYDHARETWSANERAQASERARLSAEIHLRERQAVEAAQIAASAAASRSTRKRMRNKNDSDARTLGAQTLASWAEAKASRTSGIKRRALEKAQDRLEPGSKDPTIGALIALKHEPAPKRLLAALSKKDISVGDTVILRQVDVMLERDAHVHIRGANGAGKSTLVRALLDAAMLPHERVLYLPQELSSERIAAEMRALRELDRVARGRLLSLVAALGCDPDALLATPSPSPGEARKLVIARGLLQEPWLVVLDEPTNHMDLATTEKLEVALAAFPGALLLVTHDDRFAQACTTLVWEISEGRVG